MKFFILIMLGALGISCTSMRVYPSMEAYEKEVAKNGPQPGPKIILTENVNDVGGNHFWGNGYSGHFQTPSYYRQGSYNDRGGSVVTTTTRVDSFADYRKSPSDDSGKSREKQKKDFLRRARVLDDR